MGAFVHRSALLVSALFIGGLATAAPTRAEVNEVRIGFGYGLVYLTRMVAEEQRYFAAQAKKTGAGNFVVSTRRLSGLKYARFMARTGQLKHEPKSRILSV
jgi:ABC-type nitrate/sulfonate/bicarbonate transport system substrate-binding protein